MLIGRYSIVVNYELMIASNPTAVGCGNATVDTVLACLCAIPMKSMNAVLSYFAAAGTVYGNVAHDEILIDDAATQLGRDDVGVPFNMSYNTDAGLSSGPSMLDTPTSFWLGWTRAKTSAILQQGIC